MVAVKGNEKCFGCGVSEPTMWYTPVLDIGMQAVVKFKDKKDEEDDLAPLLLRQCNSCKLVQLSHIVDKDRLFRQYHYRSGINDTMRKELFSIVEKAEKWVELGFDDWVIDIGSNDGTLLNCYRRCIKVVGFEPAKNIQAIYGIRYVNDYFNLKDTQGLIKLHQRKPKVITAIAMFYDLEDPNKFLQDVKAVLHEDGVFIIQINILDKMVKNFSVDNISHEHLCYYSVDTLRAILEKNGFTVIEISTNDINGGSVRMYCRFGPYRSQFEASRDMPLEVDWNKFRTELEQKRASIRDTIEKECEKHKNAVWAYGASTRGYSLLQWLGVEKYITKIADKNPEKWGKFLGKIPITSEGDMRLSHPPFVLVLPYSFKNEFIKREKEYFARGGKMIFPLPELEYFP